MKLLVISRSLWILPMVLVALHQDRTFGFSLLEHRIAVPRQAAWVVRKSDRGLIPSTSCFKPKALSSSEFHPDRDSKAAMIGANENIFSTFLNGLWKGVTLPFPSLRGLAKARSNAKKKKELVVFWSVKECLFAIAAYMAVGVVAYSFILEKWSIVDSLYFSCVCFSTVGYGDLCPRSPVGRLFTCFFGLGGIVFLGTAVANVASHVVQAELEATQAARKVSQKRITQFVDHMLPSFLKNLTHHDHHQNSTEFEHHRLLWPLMSNAPISGFTSRVGAIVKQVAPSLGVLALGGIWIGRLSGWNWIDSLYYATVTASTIGLGDLAPTTRAARLWSVLFIPLSVATAGELLSSLATTLVQHRQKIIFHRLIERDLTLQHLQAMDLDNSGQVSREEYLIFMLLEMGHVSLEEIQELQAQFARLDVAKTGFLDHNDLRLLAELRKKNATL